MTFAQHAEVLFSYMQCKTDCGTVCFHQFVLRSLRNVIFCFVVVFLVLQVFSDVAFSVVLSEMLLGTLIFVFLHCTCFFLKSLDFVVFTKCCVQCFVVLYFEMLGRLFLGVILTCFPLRCYVL